MSDYLCVDGPLAGHLYGSEEQLGIGDTVTVALLAIDGLTPGTEAQPGARYAVESDARGESAGVLRFVAAHGFYRKPALPASFREPTLA